MATATVHWLNERNFVGIDSTGHSVVLSGQKHGIGVSPSQMLLDALASCSSVDVVEILEKKRLKLEYPKPVLLQKRPLAGTVNRKN